MTLAIITAILAAAVACWPTKNWNGCGLVERNNDV